MVCEERRWQVTEEARQKKLEARRRWYANNPDYHNKWRKANPEKARRLTREWARRNRDKMLEHCRRWRAENRERARHTERVRNWKKKYGLTPEAAKALWESHAGQCAICDSKEHLCVDHDHKTGKIRGLLCRSCNLMLGNSRDQIEILRRAEAYLQKHL